MLRSPLGDLAHEETLQGVIDTLVAGITVTDALSEARLEAIRLLLVGTLKVDPGDGVSRDLTVRDAIITPGAPLTITPSAAGKAIRVWWVSVQPWLDNATTGQVIVNLAGKGNIYRQTAVSHRQRFDGSVDGTLTVTVTDGTFFGTVHYEEI